MNQLPMVSATARREGSLCRPHPPVPPPPNNRDADASDARMTCHAESSWDLLTLHLLPRLEQPEHEEYRKLRCLCAGGGCHKDFVTLQALSSASFGNHGCSFGTKA